MGYAAIDIGTDAADSGVDTDAAAVDTNADAIFPCGETKHQNCLVEKVNLWVVMSSPLQTAGIQTAFVPLWLPRSTEYSSHAFICVSIHNFRGTHK